MTGRLGMILALALAGTPAAAGPEYIAVKGPLDEDTFYRLVACGAEPGGPCQKPLVRWDVGRPVTVALAPAQAGFPAYKYAGVRQALSEAVAEIQSLGTGLSLELRPEGSPADIQLFATSARQGGVIEGTGFRGLDGIMIEAGLVTVWWKGNSIESAGIALSADLRRRSIRSVVLEELVQALGLGTDIRGPAYARSSIFDEDSNTVTRLTGPDAAALRRHYPPTDRLIRSSSQ